MQNWTELFFKSGKRCDVARFTTGSAGNVDGSTSISASSSAESEGISKAVSFEVPAVSAAVIMLVLGPLDADAIVGLLTIGCTCELASG